MDRWGTWLCSALALVTLSLAVTEPVRSAEQASLVILGGESKVPYRQFEESFKQYLSQQGEVLTYLEIPVGDDVHGDEELQQIIQRNRVPLILTLGTRALRSALAQQVERPVISGLTLDADTLQTTKNATGVVLEYGPETQLQWLKRLLPGYRSIGVLYNPAESGQRIAAAKQAARKLGLNLVAQEVNSPKELPVALESLLRRVDVLWGITDPVVMSRQTAKALLLESFRNQVPFVAPSSAWVKAGALYSLDCDYPDLGVQTGEIALQVLRGEDVQSIAPQVPRKVNYSLNVRTAKHMKIKFTSEVLNGAAQVFE